MTEKPTIRDRAAALGNALHELRREAALAGDVENLVPIKTADRELKRAFGRGELPGDPYSDLKERLIDQAYAEDVAEEQVILHRIESLTANVRAEVEAELAGEREELLAAAASVARDLEAREQNVAARERKASPSYRAAFATAGAFLTLAADLLVRTVA
jgi:hypothetical protein